MSSTNAKYSLNPNTHGEGGTELAEMDGDEKQEQNQPQAHSPESQNSTQETNNDDFDSGEDVDSGPNRPRTETFEEADPLFIKKVKGVTTCVALMVFVIIVIYPPMTLVHVECIEDKIQDGLQNHYDYYAKNAHLKNTLMITFGALTDFLLLAFMAKWTYQGGTWRFMICMFLTYLLRFFLCALFKMQPPPGGDLWKFPGFYSLTMEYDKQTDYYFNPVISLTTQLFFEYRVERNRVLQWLSFAAMVGNFYLSLMLKGHYLIDNYGGLVLGYYIWIVSNNWLSYYVDVKLFGMTLHERFTYIPTSCGMCKTEINQWVQFKELAQNKGEISISSKDKAISFNSGMNAVPTGSEATEEGSEEQD